MKESNVDTLIEVRDIFARIHDSQITVKVRRGFSNISDIEMAAIRDSIRRINEVLDSESKPLETLNEK